MRATMKLQIQFQPVGNFDGGAAISFQAVNHHQTVALFSSSVKNQGAQKRTRKLPTSKSSSSSSDSVQRSIFVQCEDEERNTPVVSKKISTRSSSNSHPPIFHHKTVGVLGGASVISTLTFLEKLVWWSTNDGGVKHVSQEGESVPFIVCSDPLQSFKSDGGQDRDSFIIEKLKKKRAFLEDGGAECIVMPCHVSHVWFDEISDGCSLPFLNLAECVAWELKGTNLKPLEAGSRVRIGVIATDAVLMGGFYQEKLQNQGFEVVLPDKASMERIVIPAINALKRKDMEGARNLLRIAIQMLLVRAVNVVILACDELQALLPHDDPLLKHCLDPIDVLARSTVRYAKSVKGYTKNLKGA